MRAPDSITRMWGQLVSPSGQPASGVGLVIARRNDDVTLATTVSDANGLFVLPFIIPEEAEDEKGNAFEYDLLLSVNEDAIPLDLSEVPVGLYGPHRLVVERPPPDGWAGVAPRAQLLASEEETIAAFKSTPQLFTRPASARPPDPCSPYAQNEVPARTFFLAQAAMFPAAQRDSRTSRRESLSRSIAQGDMWQFADQLRYGVILDFRQDWWDVGFALGDLLYSVALAPCEETKVATVDWRRHDYARRQTALDESHFQDSTTHRNEMVNEALFMTSPKGITGTTEAGGGALSLGIANFGYDKSVNTVTEAVTSAAAANRYINDRIKQVTNTLRNTRAFAVAEVNQEEESVVRTRILRNHNHCHTVTFQYFEVLRHYLMSTLLTDVRPAVFVPFGFVQFTSEVLRTYGYMLRRALVDPTLEPVLDRILGVLAPPTEGEEPQLEAGTEEGASAEQMVSEVEVAAYVQQETFHSGGGFPWPGRCLLIVNEQEVELATQTKRGQKEVGTYTLNEALPFSSIRRIGLQNSGLATALTLQDVVFRAKVGTRWREIAFTASVDLPDDSRFITEVDALPAIPAAVAPAGPLDGEDRLLAHLNANRAYYTGALLAGGDRGLRFMALAALTDWEGRSLADVVENEPMGFVGNYAAFPLLERRLPPGLVTGGDEEEWPTSLPAQPDERIVTLPTPGVFAESQLGGCSACEKIDDTRFWDWQTSPCPGEAPEITEGMLASRFQNLKDLVEVVKSELVPQPVQIPEQPEPMIKVGDETLKELVKDLDLTGAEDVLGFLGGLAKISADGFKALLEAVRKKPGGPGGGAAAPEGDAGAAGEAGLAEAGTAGAAEALPASGAVIGAPL
jgi:hypothetical protein